MVSVANVSKVHSSTQKTKTALKIIFTKLGSSESFVAFWTFYIVWISRLCRSSGCSEGRRLKRLVLVIENDRTKLAPKGYYSGLSRVRLDA